jgi:hypothetical protein
MNFPFSRQLYHMKMKLHYNRKMHVLPLLPQHGMSPGYKWMKWLPFTEDICEHIEEGMDSRQVVANNSFP